MVGSGAPVNIQFDGKCGKRYTLQSETYLNCMLDKQLNMNQKEKSHDEKSVAMIHLHARMHSTKITVSCCPCNNVCA